MKIRKIVYVIITIVLLPIGLLNSWGEEGHKLIALKAFDLLPPEMEAFEMWKSYVIEHSSDPDYRRNEDSTEGPKHYIDIDYYDEFLDGKMEYDKQVLVEKYGDSIVTDIGILPWATVETFRNLKKAFEEKERDKILIYMADLSHYVADGHQPMHTMLNYNGQLTGQKGIHSRYETKLINSNLMEITNNLAAQQAEYVETPLDYIFNYILKSYSFGSILFDADIYASERAGDTQSDDYYRLFWYRTQYITFLQFNNAAHSLASLIYTAWKNAGEPDFNEIN